MEFSICHMAANRPIFQARACNSMPSRKHPDHSGNRWGTQGRIGALALLILVFILSSLAFSSQERKRARELGISVGVLEPGRWNGITDVEGVKVGHCTLKEGQGIRTGVTAILPHEGNLYRKKVPAAVYVGNGFGKLMGTTQVDELGNLETPILLTATLNVPKVADALIEYMLSLPDMEEVRSINPIVGETNDGYLNQIRNRPVEKSHVFEAIRSASSGPVLEGSVGAGTGTSCYGFKGGIGTSSRVLPGALGGFTVGVLVQSNFGGILEINGAPVGQELGRYYLKEALVSSQDDSADGSCMMVVATNAPLTPRNLKRLAKRAMFGMAATGSPSTNGSGDYVIAFSTSFGRPALGNSEISPLFQAAKEATQEAIYNSIFMATSITGRDGNHREAIPLDRVSRILREYRVIND
jgi:D-aminopeptidase